ncbi:MAG TPA: hypothetical protein VN366_13495 [Feifaniaceae bacterium]|nr:hypothetical protein [Feifaniaceae bacterium]
MPDYEQMYYDLFNYVSRAIEILQKGQQECEELYMGADNNKNEAENEQ